MGGLPASLEAERAPVLEVSMAEDCLRLLLLANVGLGRAPGHAHRPLDLGRPGAAAAALTGALPPRSRRLARRG